MEDSREAIKQQLDTLFKSRYHEMGQLVSTTHKIEIQQTGDQFVATVPSIGAVVTGETEEAALREAERAIVARMIEEAEKRKRRRRGKGHTVA